MKRKTNINKKYSHFAVHTATGKIVDGWEYGNLDKDDIKYYFKQDAKDNDYSLKEFKCIDALTLFKRGVNPYDSDNWSNVGDLYNLVEAVVVEAVDYSDLPQNDSFVITKDYLEPNCQFADATEVQKAQIKKDGFTVHFMMYDDDQELYYGGYLKTKLEGSEGAFRPLEDWGMPNAGCTDIKYKEADGKYHSL